MARSVSRILCLVFALLGALPLGAGFAAQSEFARTWASTETSRVLREWLGLKARYRVQLSLAPLRLALEEVRVEATTGDYDALTAERVTITPQIFSLLAGRLDVGDLEVTGLRQKLVFRGGELSNLEVHLPKSDEETTLRRSPFRTLSATDARIHLDLDGVHLETGSIDLDVFALDKLTFETALRVGESTVRYPDNFFSSGQTFNLGPNEVGPRQLMQWDEDRLCSLDARIQVSPEGLLVRRLQLQAAVDINPERDTQVVCQHADQSPDAEPLDLAGTLNLQMRQTRFEAGQAEEPWFSKGSLKAHVPVDLVNRFTDTTGRFEGWAKVEGDFRFDGTTRMPRFSGKFETGEFLLAKFRLVEHASGTVDVQNDEIIVPRLLAGYGGGDVEIEGVRIAPLADGAPLTSESVVGRNIRFPHLIRDIQLTPNTIVNWDLSEIRVTGFSGTLDSPTRLDGNLFVTGHNFEIFDRAYPDPIRQHIVGIAGETRLRGAFGLHSDGIEFNDVTATFPNSQLRTTVHVGFDNRLKIDLPQATIDLAALSPLVTVPLAGKATLTAAANDAMDDPSVRGTLAVEDLMFADFPLGTLERSTYHFKPLLVTFSDAALRKNRSLFSLPQMTLDFGAVGSTIQAQASVAVREASIRDFLAMWELQDDPQWLDLKGSIDARARVDYTLGGKRDPCGSGAVRVAGSAQLSGLTLFEENFSNANTDFDFNWEDIDAGYHGFHLNLTNFALRKGSGSLLGTVHIEPGAALSGNLVATSIPLNQIQSLGSAAHYASGTVSAFGTVGGTLDQLRADVQTVLSPVVIGRTRLPASRLAVRLIPSEAPVQFNPERTGCNRPIPAELPPASASADTSLGDFHVQGQLFAGAVQFTDFSISRQENKVARGKLTFDSFDLAPFFELRPEVALQKERPSGHYTGTITLDRLPLNDMARARASAEIDELVVRYRGFRFRVDARRPVHVADGELTLPDTRLEAATSAGYKTRFDVTGKVTQLHRRPTLDVAVELYPVDLAHWAQAFDAPEQIGGTVAGRVELDGPWDAPKPAGGFVLKDGLFQRRRDQATISQVNAEVGFGRGTLEVRSVTAKVGGGHVTGKGSAPFAGLALGDFRGTVIANDINIPTLDGIDITVDANLEALWSARRQRDDPTLPKVTGDVLLKHFRYTRPVTMNADIATLARRGRRTEFESYDPSDDFVELDLLVNAGSPIRLSNNLIEAALRIDRPGLQLTGTNQRFGMRGRLEIVPGGRIRIRRSEFEIQNGEIRFADPTAIAPLVDVNAVTEYRRYSSSGSADAATEVGGGGEWRIFMRAHGDADDLKIDLTSQPKLSQDDIFVLLTVGLTRAELDQARSVGVGESVALEALGSLTGADTAVTEAIPVIDEFRFGSAYSSRSGRTEPTITIGKRLSERIRAYVTSGLSESREVRSNVEWQLSPQVSVESSYDNVNDISSSSFGNLGADVRWRLEF